MFAPVAVANARSGGDGWESNPPRTPQQRPANGFEDRGPRVHISPWASAQVRFSATAVRGRPLSSVVVRALGCLLGCHYWMSGNPLDAASRRSSGAGSVGCRTTRWQSGDPNCQSRDLLHRYREDGLSLLRWAVVSVTRTASQSLW